VSEPETPPERGAPAVAEVCDTTRLRHLGLYAFRHGRQDLIIRPGGLLVPDVVADPNDPSGNALLDCDPDELCELARHERVFRLRHETSRDPSAWTSAEALQSLRLHPDLRVLHMTDFEADDAELYRRGWAAADPSLTGLLGPGESAVLAIADARGLRAGLDDLAARNYADRLGVEWVTTQDSLVRLVAENVIDPNEAQHINAELRGGGFLGDPWLPFPAA
jgi:hypothetical protein